MTARSAPPDPVTWPSRLPDAVTPLVLFAVPQVLYFVTFVVAFSLPYDSIMARWDGAY